MTWEQWVNSAYNTGGFYLDVDYISDGFISVAVARKTDIIEAEYDYHAER